MKHIILFVIVSIFCFTLTFGTEAQQRIKQRTPQEKVNQPKQGTKQSATNQPDQKTSQPPNDQLIEAVKCGNMGKVKTLLAQGADPNVRSGEKGDTPLLIAAWRGDTETAAALIEKGADVNTPDQSTSEYPLRPLFVAAACGRVEVVKLLLASKGIDAKVVDKAGGTAWTHAAFAEDDTLTSKVRELLAAKETPAVPPSFVWISQQDTYACRRNLDLVPRFKGKNCQ